MRAQPQLASSPAIPANAVSTRPPRARATGELTTSDFNASGFTPVPLPPRVQLPPPIVTRGLLVQGFVALAFVASVFAWLRTSSSRSVSASAATSRLAPAAAVTAALAGADPLGQALEAERQGRLDDALRLFNTSVAQNPSSAPALAGLASVEQARGAPADAIADYRRALTADATSLPARLGLADLLWDNGQLAEARRFYQSIVDAPAGNYPDRVKARATEPPAR
jgi:Tfp pilus assembly protein PilF